MFENKAWKDFGYIQLPLYHLANVLTYRCLVPQALSLNIGKCPEESNIYMTENLSFYKTTYFILKKKTVDRTNGRWSSSRSTWRTFTEPNSKMVFKIKPDCSTLVIIDRLYWLHWSIYCCEDSVDVLLSGEYIIGLHYNSHLP